MAREKGHSRHAYVLPLRLPVKLATKEEITTLHWLPKPSEGVSLHIGDEHSKLLDRKKKLKPLKMYSCKSIKISFIFFNFLFDLYTDIFDFTLIKQKVTLYVKLKWFECLVIPSNINVSSLKSPTNSLSPTAVILKSKHYLLQ